MEMSVKMQVYLMRMRKLGWGVVLVEDVVVGWFAVDVRLAMCSYCTLPVETTPVCQRKDPKGNLPNKGDKDKDTQ